MMMVSHPNGLENAWFWTFFTESFRYLPKLHKYYSVLIRPSAILTPFFSFKRQHGIQAWWCTPLIPALTGQRQVDPFKFHTSLVYKATFRAPRTVTHRNPVSKNKNKSSKNKNQCGIWIKSVLTLGHLSCDIHFPIVFYYKDPQTNYYRTKEGFYWLGVLEL